MPKVVEDKTFPRNPPAGEYAPGVLSVGVELECLMSEITYRKITDWYSRGNCGRMAIESDGSIHRDNREDMTAEYTFWSTNRDEMEAWLEQMWKFGIRTNSSCGFHVHVRPKPQNLYIMATKTYWQEFHKRYKEFAGKMKEDSKYKYLSRLTCQWSRERPWSMELVANAKKGGGDRYTSINLSSLVKHGIGAVEHRIMPNMYSAEEAMKAVDWLAGFVVDTIAGNAEYDERNIATPAKGKEVAETKKFSVFIGPGEVEISKHKIQVKTVADVKQMQVHMLEVKVNV